MKKTILFSLLMTISYNLKAEEVKARITYRIEDNRILAIIVYSKDEIKRQKCEELIRDKEMRNILKKQSNKVNEKIIKLTLTCNV